MKRFNSSLLKATFYTAVVVGIFTIVSCNQQKDTKEIAEDSNDAKFSNAKQDDAAFLVSAAEINLEEIELGKLAQTNSAMPEVKELGKMMELEHTKAQVELRMLATKKQIDIPTTITSNGKDAYNKLKDKFGVEFDDKYCDMMIDGHKDAISKFEKEFTDTKDPDIQTWSESMLNSLRNHLNHSIDCKKKCEQMRS